MERAPGRPPAPIRWSADPFERRDAEWPNGRMAEWPNGRMAEWPDGRMAEWPNGRMAEWPDGRMAGWPDGRMAGWPDGRMAEWPNGRMAGWPYGRMAGWPDGRMARWPAAPLPDATARENRTGCARFPVALRFRAHPGALSQRVSKRRLHHKRRAPGRIVSTRQLYGGNQLAKRSRGRRAHAQGVWGPAPRPHRPYGPV
jgi:hypothetical protein